MPNPVVAAATAPTFSFLGLQFQFLVTDQHTGGNLCMMRNAMVPGLMVPLHSHADPEIFHVLEGEMEVYQDGQGWSTVHAGEVLALEGSIKHALRNPKPCVCMTSTGAQLIHFFKEASVPLEQAPPPGPLTPEQVGHLMTLAAKWKMWISSPEENAAIGLSLA